MVRRLDSHAIFPPFNLSSPRQTFLFPGKSSVLCSGFFLGAKKIWGFMGMKEGELARGTCSYVFFEGEGMYLGV